MTAFIRSGLFAGVVVVSLLVAGCAAGSSESVPTPTDSAEPVVPSPAPPEEKHTPAPEPTADAEPYALPDGFSMVIDDGAGPALVFDARDGWAVYEQFENVGDKHYLTTVTDRPADTFDLAQEGVKGVKTELKALDLLQWAFTSPSFGTVFGISDNDVTWYEIRYWDVDAGTQPRVVWSSADPLAEIDRVAFQGDALYFTRQVKGRSCLSSMTFDGARRPESTIKDVVCADQRIRWVQAAPDGTVSYLVDDETTGEECTRLYRIVADAKEPELVAVPGECVGRGRADSTYAIWSDLPQDGTRDSPLSWTNVPMYLMTIADGQVTELGNGEAGSEQTCEGGVAWNVHNQGRLQPPKIMRWTPATGPQTIYESTRWDSPEGIDNLYRLYGLHCFEDKIAFMRAGTVIEEDYGIDEWLYRTGPAGT